MAGKKLIKIVALGDSLTVGFQAPSEFMEGSEEYPYNHFLEIILDREIPRKGLVDLEVSLINVGMLGDTTRGMLERFEVHVASKNPDFVIVWGGINDLMSLSTPEEVMENLEEIYSKARKLRIKPIACTLTPTLGLGEIQNKIVQLNEMIRKHCKENSILLADLYRATADESGMLRGSFSSDGVHLTNAGYQRIAYTIYIDVIEKILDQYKPS